MVYLYVMKVEQNSPSTKVVCIDTRDITTLTIGRVYDANTSQYIEAYYIFNDSGYSTDYHKNRFKKLEDVRDEKLLSILED